MRYPKGELSQRSLVLELRMAIDDCRMVGPRTTERTLEKRRARLQRLISKNDISIFSSHVLYNIGKERREWLLRYMETH
jgi:hypothetical protein